MTATQVVISLPDDLRQKAEAIGLLTSQAIEQLLREEIRRRNINQFFAAADRLAELNLPPLTEAEIEAEIEAVRRSNRA